MKETWKPVFNAEQFYSISSLGRVRREKSGRGTRKNKILKPILAINGYLFVYLSMGKSKRFKKFIHILVAEAFIGKRPEKHQVHHKNTIPSDNRKSNLEYITSKENIMRSIANGTHFIPKGSQHGRAKLKEKDIPIIKKLYEKGDKSYKDIAEMFNLKSICPIARIIKGTGWTHV